MCEMRAGVVNCIFLRRRNSLRAGTRPAAELSDDVPAASVNHLVMDRFATLQ